MPVSPEEGREGEEKSQMLQDGCFQEIFKNQKNNCYGK
jgi:hypothetical protein